MIIDIILNIVIWLFQNTVLRLMYVNLPLLSYSEYQSLLMTIRTEIVPPFSSLNNLFPIDLLIIFVIIMLIAELVLLMIKGSMYVINLIRGSGA